MSNISRINQQVFINILDSKTFDEKTDFALEYYVGPYFFYLYKSIDVKNFKNTIHVIVVDEEQQTVIWRGKQVSVDEFLEDIKINNKAIELVEPIDIQDIYLKHYHDVHLHVFEGTNDVFRSL